MKKNVLIAGGAGFVGANLCQKILLAGDNVICVDDLSTGSTRNISSLLGQPNFTFIEHDITHVLKINKPIDQIYNLACPASPPKYQKNPIKTLKINFQGTINLLELAKEKQSSFLFASTSEVYGDPEVHPQDESYRGSVNTVGKRACYDEGKRIAETLCYEFNKVCNLDVKIVRIFNTYGPLMDPDDGRVISNFIMQALRNEDITIYGDGTQTRSFQFVDDLVSGLFKYMDSTEKYLGPINMGNPVEFTMLELAKLVLSLIPESKSKIKFLTLPDDDPKRRKPCIKLASKRLKWTPEVSLEIGLGKTIKYFRSF
jgi:UDP-glucuronate decarboxylase